MSDISRDKLLKTAKALKEHYAGQLDLSDSFKRGFDHAIDNVIGRTIGGDFNADTWIPVSTPPETCVWEYNHIWRSACGWANGSTKTNYCPNCGKLVTTPPEGDKE